MLFFFLYWTSHLHSPPKHPEIQLGPVLSFEFGGAEMFFAFFSGEINTLSLMTLAAETGRSIAVFLQSQKIDGHMITWGVWRHSQPIPVTHTHTLNKHTFTKNLRTLHDLSVLWISHAITHTMFLEKSSARQSPGRIGSWLAVIQGHHPPPPTSTHTIHQSRSGQDSVWR